MKKILILVCGALFFATSCLSGSGPQGTSSADYVGKLVVSDIESGDVTYTDDNAKVTVWIPNLLEPKFDIVFNDVKFANAMPVKLDIEFDGIPFTTTISEDQTTLNYVFSANDIIPNVGGVPYNNYKVDVIKGSIGRPVVIEFSMSSKGSKVHFTTATQE